MVLRPAVFVYIGDSPGCSGGLDGIEYIIFCDVYPPMIIKEYSLVKLRFFLIGLIF